MHKLGEPNPAPPTPERIARLGPIEMRGQRRPLSPEIEEFVEARAHFVEAVFGPLRARVERLLRRLVP
jgi:hypothetical protein